MTHLRRALLIAAFAAVAGVSVGGAAAKSFEQELPATPGERLVIKLETGAAIEIVGWNRDAVAVEAEFTGRDRDQVVFEVARSSSGIRITSEFSGSQRRHSSGGRVRIQLPHRFDLDIETTGGEIRIAGVEGDLRGETMGGELVLEDLRGELDLSTMGGNVRLSDSEVDGQVGTMGGNVIVKNVCGSVEATTMGGDVRYENVDDACGGSCREVKISTMGGDVNAPDAMCGADLETMGGNITIDRAAEHVKAETMGGNIRIGEVDGWVRATTMGGNVEVTMVGDPSSGRRDVRLDSSGGDITLSVPAGMSMEVEITLVYTKKSQQNYEIDSDFELDIRRSADWEYQDGQPRKTLYGQATFGGGEHKVRIETINGNVRLIRQ